MPLYEYVCEECSTVYTELRKFSDDAPSPCPSCGSKKTHKKISAFSGGRSAGSCAPSGGG